MNGKNTEEAVICDLGDLHRILSHELAEMAVYFKNPKMTLVVRAPQLADGDLILTDDSLADALIAIERLRSRQDAGHDRFLRVPLSERESVYLQSRADILDVEPGRVLQQALRIYQLWQRYPQLGTRMEELMDAETGPSPGCGHIE